MHVIGWTWHCLLWLAVLALNNQSMYLDLCVLQVIVVGIKTAERVVINPKKDGTHELLVEGTDVRVRCYLTFTSHGCGCCQRRAAVFKSCLYILSEFAVVPAEFAVVPAL